MKKYLRFSYFVQIAIYTLIHFLAGVFGFFLNGLGNNEVFFWPPSGLALAVLLFFGYRFWPGIFLGNFLSGFSSGFPLIVVFTLGLTGALTALTATYILKRLAFHNRIEKVGDITNLAFIAAPAAGLIPAFFIPLASVVGGVIVPSSYLNGFLNVWKAYLLSTIIATPFLITWLFNHAIPTKSIKKILETVALYITVFILGTFVFTNTMAHEVQKTYLVFFPIIWAALRYGPREVSTVIMVYAIQAVWSTMHSVGPFATSTLINNLLNLQSFMIIVSIMSMILAAATFERRELGRRKNNFIGMAAHELKTPLTSIKIIAQLLKKRSTTDKKETEYLIMMNDQIDKLTNLVKNLLDISKIQAGKLKFNKDHLWLRDIIDTNVKAMAYADSKHTIIVRGKISRKVYVDKDRIGQVIMNLLNNAIKYSPHGKEVIIDISEVNNHAQITVKDYGIGIPKERLHKIFERFYQFSKKETIGGLGLGLFISAEIVKQHNGKMWVESLEGKGSMFYFTLPIN